MRRGLGEVICFKFAAEGCNVAINYVSSEEKAKELKGKFEGEFGVRVVCLRGVGYILLSSIKDVIVEVYDVNRI